MESKALLVMNYRQLALVFEQMESVAKTIHGISRSVKKPALCTKRLPD